MMRSLNSAEEIINTLKANGDLDRAKAMRFFREDYTDPKDIFLNVAHPLIDSVARRALSLSLQELACLIQSPYHEARSCALRVWKYQFQRAMKKNETTVDDFAMWYLKALREGFINNWDLVDESAPVLGRWILQEKHDEIFEQLMYSKTLWLERASIVLTLPMIKEGRFHDIYRAVHQFKTHSHDLIHKPLGWMLREVGKYDQDELFRYLEKHAAILPRTTLRYALEKMTPKERHYFLKKKTAG